MLDPVACPKFHICWRDDVVLDNGVLDPQYAQDIWTVCQTCVKVEDEDKARTRDPFQVLVPSSE